MGIVWVRFGYFGADKMKEPLIYKGSCGGRNRTRTCDPIDVNDVLYQLSHATIRCTPSSDDVINHNTGFWKSQA